MPEYIPYMTRLYRSRKALGCCPNCGGKRDLPGRIICSKCLAGRREIYVRKAACLTDEEKAARSKKACEAQKIRRKQLREEGRCAACGAPSPDHYYCDACRTKQSRSKKKKETDSNG